MAGQVKNLKIKGGRFYARVSVPAHLRPTLGKSELVTALGGERRAAMRALPAAVATLQRQIAAAEAKTAGDRMDDLRTPITTADYGSAVWKRYQAMLAEDEAKRDRLPSGDAIEAEQDRLMQRAQAGQIALADPLAVLDASLDLLVMKDAQAFDQSARRAKLDALRADLTENRTHLVEHEIDAYLDRHSLTAPEGSAERATLAKRLMRAEIEALHGAPFKDWVLPGALEQIRRKLQGSSDGDRQMVKILGAVLTEGMPEVQKACAEALSQSVHSADVILNILSRRRDPEPAPLLLTSPALRLTHEPVADCARYDLLRRAS